MAIPNPVNMHFMFSIRSSDTWSRLSTCEVNVAFEYGEHNTAYLDKALAAGVWGMCDLKPWIGDVFYYDPDKSPAHQLALWNANKATVLSKINAVKNHAALYGYHTLNEPNLVGCEVDYGLQLTIYNFIHNADPDHYVTYAIAGGPGGHGYASCNMDACDFLIPNTYSHAGLNFACSSLRAYFNDNPGVTEPPLVFTVCACNEPGNTQWRGNIDTYVGIVNTHGVGTGGIGMWKWWHDGEDCQSNNDVLAEVVEAWGENVWPPPEEENQPPTAPTSLLCEGLSNPTGITDLTPEFSAIYNDPDSGDKAMGYLVYVATSIAKLVYNPPLGYPDMWNSQFINIEAQNLFEGNRCQDITYAGSPLSLNGQTYYWKIVFQDIGGLVGAWSSPAEFQMLGMIYKSLSGGLSFAGNLPIKVRVSLSGAFSFGGNLVAFALWPLESIKKLIQVKMIGSRIEKKITSIIHKDL